MTKLIVFALATLALIAGVAAVTTVETTPVVACSGAC
jgi:hypothetical protein